jgi:hypothetical protein
LKEGSIVNLYGLQFDSFEVDVMEKELNNSLVSQVLLSRSQLCLGSFLSIFLILIAIFNRDGKQSYLGYLQFPHLSQVDEFFKDKRRLKLSNVS